MAPTNGGGGGPSRTVFGQSMKKKNTSSSASSSRYQRQFGGNRRRNQNKNNSNQYGGNYNNNNSNNANANLGTSPAEEGSHGDNDFDVAEWKRRRQAKAEALDKSFGMERFAWNPQLHHRAAIVKKEKKNNSSNAEVQERRGWLYNVLPTTVASSGDGPERSGMDLFFCTDADRNFKSTVLYRPYFYVLLDPDALRQSDQQKDILLELVTSTLLRLYDGVLHSVETVHRHDLDQPNHLSPQHLHGRAMLKLVFDNVSQLTEVRMALQDHISTEARRNNVGGGTTTKPSEAASYLTRPSSTTTNAGRGGYGSLLAPPAAPRDPLSLLVDLREYDVPYVVRVCTDLDIRAGTWYTVQATPDDDDGGGGGGGGVCGGIRLVDPDRESKAHPTVLAFDIECTKAPLKFPSAEVDEIYMISYMVSLPNGGVQGYLILSRSVVAADVDDFEYTPQPAYPGPFQIFNEANEKALLERFFTEFQKHRPHIVVTYNGDGFDWPFVDQRAQHHRLDLFAATGVAAADKDGGPYLGRTTVHLDAFHWVQRDSYLPQGAQGLKAVTKYKLGYDPVEVDPEDMLPLAQTRPTHMAAYSVSDAVATFYVYEKYVHLFIFSLCTVIPLGPEDVLRKGSGTLCECLLMVQACTKHIVCPNKQVDAMEKFHQGHLVESETYIGGKVECLETGVYRSDVEYDFDLVPAALDELIAHLDRDLSFAIEVEAGRDRSEIVNYDEVRSAIIEQLEGLRDRPQRTEKPYIYHLDVGAMYPNIILTNRLQPSSMVDDAACAACDFHSAKNGCQRRMDWVWRGEYSPASRHEYQRTKQQLLRETTPSGEEGLLFRQQSPAEQAKKAAARLKTYAQKAYKKTKVTEEATRQDVVCMRENDFYVDTVRQFRDRRYEFKKLNKTWQKRAAQAGHDKAKEKQCLDKVLVYDSLQVAHKCILNSFYGYVMRKGARWRSMEMAGIVTKAGADIITQARVLVEQIGRPLELDTDGIWCILPKSFPDVYTFEAKDGSKIKLEYPCVMLNANVHDKFTNHQYQTVVDPERGIYETRSECSIFFEVDGPYRAMILPASTEEGKLLKKRYAVFNFDGSLAELKGFELKRRGELELIKTFQSQVFERFLDGDSLEECYQSVAEVANHWIDVIDTRGQSLEDDELVDLISENKNMSRQLDDYGDQKGTSQTTARRLGEFLGAEIIKDKGLACKFIIAEQPFGAPVTERAIPTAIWKAHPTKTKYYLRKWLKAPGLDGEALDIRNILDWDYYLERLGNTIRKIITIPAALQKVANPVPRVGHPSWLESKINQLNDPFKQKTITEMFAGFQKPRAIEAGPTGKSDGEKRASSNTVAVLDIEDIGTSTNTGAKRPLVHRTKRIRGRQEPAETDSTVANVPAERVHLSKDTFSSWITQKKSIWRRTRRERRSAASKDVAGASKKQRKDVSVEGFLRDAVQSLEEMEWQIIEVREMSSYDSLSAGQSSYSSGDFTVWVMVGGDTLQKLSISVPRTVFVATNTKVTSDSKYFIEFRQADKHLPHGRRAAFVYEVSMPEYVYRTKNWLSDIYPVGTNVPTDKIFDCVYESSVPLRLRILSALGSVVRLKPMAKRSKGSRSYQLDELKRVDKPQEGEYLRNSLAYRRIFLYVRIHPGTKVGIVAVFTMEGGSGTYSNNAQDLTRPSAMEAGTFDIGASCQIWIVKPGSRRSAQRSISLQQCKGIFGTTLSQLEEADLEEYACVSPESELQVEKLHFVDTEDMALAGANDLISSQSKRGATFVLINSGKPSTQLRRHIPALGSLPIVPMPFPPGPEHNPSSSTLPALNWEHPAVQYSLEAYLFLTVTSFPKRVAYSRYGHIPLGNLDDDDNAILFDVGFSRLMEKNRALSWASSSPGHPDVGIEFLPSVDGGCFPMMDEDTPAMTQDEIWGDDNELVSPTVRRPGCFRSVCVDIDMQDLAIAALTEAIEAIPVSAIGPLMASEGNKADSPKSVTMFDANKTVGPLGDGMATSVALSILRVLVNGWMLDASRSNSVVADELLHHIYRLISSPQILLHDPALHRVVHSLMTSTFLRMLGELERLGCTIVFANFHHITVATNKMVLADAEEYIGFVLNTACTSEHGDTFSKVSLRPRQFHAHYVFLDEHNFGTMNLERVNKQDLEEDAPKYVLPDGDSDTTVVVPSVVAGWSLMHYLGSITAQEFFRFTMGRFSKEPFRKQMELMEAQGGGLALAGMGRTEDELVVYRQKMVSKHFASSLTKAVGEIAKDGYDPASMPPHVRDAAHSVQPELEFIKNVMTLLELDRDLEKQVHILRRNLLSQVGVAEYAKAAQWANPCPNFVLPDVFCIECHETRDVNLCYLPPDEEDGSTPSLEWRCENCGEAYNAHMIEQRLLGLVQLKLVRYQLQDVRCVKTRRVAARSLVPQADCAKGLTLDMSPGEAQSEMQLLHGLARLHQLGVLEQWIGGILAGYR